MSECQASRFCIGGSHHTHQYTHPSMAGSALGHRSGKYPSRISDYLPNSGCTTTCSDFKTVP
ncbi:hypothetical protein BJV74DRAFT_873147 [Russula compacta]|nr:hypothetical protein BJV74DRAFT_873147 [Russula compacta]